MVARWMVLAAALSVLGGADPVAKVRDGIHDKINELRAKGQLEALTRNLMLDAAAQKHAENMARQERSAHELDGKRSKDRIKVEGYEARAVAENVAVAPVGANKSPAAVVDAWRYSKGHYDNIMLELMTDTGIGAARGKSGKWYFCQVFAAPKDKKDNQPQMNTD
jgi:uncharacterized protein YkwD